MIKKGDQFEVEIASLSYGGQSVCKVDIEGKKYTIFVENAVPGDKSLIKVFSVKHNHAVARVEKVLVESTLRVKPKCKHFGKCGGCAMQFVSYEDQLKIKEQFARDAVTRIGGFSADIVQPIVGCDEPFYYRNKMEFSFSRTRDNELSLGLHLKRMHHDVVEQTECFLLGEFVGEFIAKIRAYFTALEKKLGKKMVAEGGAIGGLKSLAIRESKTNGDLMVILNTENLEEFDLAFLSGFAEETKKLLGEKVKSIFLLDFLNKKGQRKKLSQKKLFGNDFIFETLHNIVANRDFEFEISPQSFFQPNTRQAEKLYEIVQEYADLEEHETLLDLYCGAGTIGIFLSMNAKDVLGIEFLESAIENAKKSAIKNKIDNIKFICGDCSSEVIKLEKSVDVIVVDPPRNGLSESVIENLPKFGAKRIVYVSCNPTTFARDASMLTKKGYTLEKVQPVDMFPQTYHLECVAIFSCHR